MEGRHVHILPREFIIFNAFKGILKNIEKKSFFRYLTLRGLTGDLRVNFSTPKYLPCFSGQNEGSHVYVEKLSKFNPQRPGQSLGINLTRGEHLEQLTNLHKVV